METSVPANREMDPDTYDVFIVFHPRDKKSAEQLEVRLRPLRSRGPLRVFHTGQILPGAPTDVEVDNALARAHLFVFLLSPELLASDPERSIIEKAAKRAAVSAAKLLAVEVRACYWDHEPLLQGVTVFPLCERPRDAGWKELIGLLAPLVIPSLDQSEDVEESRRAGRLQDLLRRLQHLSSPLLTWPQTLGQDQWIDRPELMSLLEQARPGQKPVVLLGAPGSGKSALLARLAQDARRRDIAVLGIRADRLPHRMSSEKAMSRWLGLSSPVGEAISFVAKHRPVLLIIDQLDALCELVDTRTQRLAVLLSMVRQLRDTPGVAIVLSCREFEFRHDVLLKSLDALEVQLSLPAVAAVEQVLQERGVVASVLGEPLMQTLRTPQHLKTFLAIREENGNLPLFETYHGMLQHIWQERITKPKNGTKLEETLLFIVEQMADTEELSVPLAKLGKLGRWVDHLVSADILRRESGRRAAFTHQTWFAFARSQVFVTGKERLSSRLARNGGTLFFRPTLWAALVNLREAAPSRYRAELQDIWNMSLRPHIRALLMDFLGQVAEPRGEESDIVLDLISQQSPLRRRMLWAIRMNHAWFEKLEARFLPVLLREEAVRYDTWGLLANASKQNPTRVLQLLEQLWATDRGSWRFLVGILQNLEKWEDRAADLVLSITRHVVQEKLDTKPVDIIIHQMIRFVPEAAAHVATMLLEARLENGGAVDRNEEELREAAHRALDEGTGFYDLIEIAKKAPYAVLEHVWPLFAKICSNAAHRESDDRPRYRRGEMDWGRRHAGGRSMRVVYSLPGAMRTAVRGAAVTDPNRFVLFVKQWASHDCMDLHLVLAEGLFEAATSQSDMVADYLVEDPRRLLLGDYVDPIGASRDLLQAMATRLPAAKIRRLEEAIMSSSRYRNDRVEARPEWRFRRQRYNRLHRLRLLQALAESKFLSKKARRLLEQEPRALLDLDDVGAEVGEPTLIKSPMESQHMERAQIKDIVDLLTDLPDSTAWQHPTRIMEGGSIEAARELSKLAEKCPDKALAVIAQLPSGTHERPVGHVIEAIAKHDKSRGVEEIERIIFSLEGRGFSTEEYRLHVAWAFVELARRGAGLSDRACDLLRSYLKDISGPIGANPDPEEPEPTERSTSVLSSGGMYVLPEGNYRSLFALFLGYLRRDPPAVDAFLDVLEGHATRRDNPKVWRALFHDLMGFRRCERLDDLLARLEKVQPSITHCHEGARLMAHRVQWIDGDRLHGWLFALRDGQWALGAQAFGEILMRAAACRSDLEWPMRELGTVLDRTKNDVRARVGVAFAVAELFDEPIARPTCASVFAKLWPTANERCTKALLRIFSSPRCFVADTYTTQVLDVILREPGGLAHADAYILVKRLHEMCDDEPARVLALCNALLDQSMRDGSRLHRLAIAERELTDIALTLQRRPGHREAGLTLFERLLEMDLPNAHQVLPEIDLRPR